MVTIDQQIEPVKQNVEIPLEILYAHPRNYQQHPPGQIANIVESLKRWGQVRSIVVQANSDGVSYTIVAGHGVTEAAHFLVGEDVSYYERFGKLRADIIPASWPSEQVLGYLVADNYLSNEATQDEELLVELLQEQADAGYNLASLGADDETLRQMLSAINEEEGETPPGGVGSDGDEERGRLLSLLDVTLADPRHEVHSGDVWRLGKQHTLVCAHVFRDWSSWTRFLDREDCLFLPFAGPLVALADTAKKYTLVMVQPDPYIAGHILDRYAEVHGESSVRKLDRVTSTADQIEDGGEEEEEDPYER